LLFLLILGALPWTEVGCKGNDKAIAQLNEPMPGNVKPPSKIAQDGRFIVATQNGYQSIWGGSSLGRDMAGIQDELEKQAKAAAAATDKKAVTTEKKKEDELDAAPLVAGYFFFVLVAIGLGFGMPPGLWRSIALAGTILLAALLLLVQTLIGFPLSTKFDKEQKKQEEQLKAFGGDAGKGLGGGDWQPYSRLTIGYYLNWPFLLLPLGLIGVEELLAPRGKAVKRRRRYDEDDDEGDEPRKGRRFPEESDDRPRRRSSREGEDEPPPRRRAATNEGLTDRPRRRPPPDEEDDPPRRR
jgi:hypothetical protein